MLPNFKAMSRLAVILAVIGPRPPKFQGNAAFSFAAPLLGAVVGATIYRQAAVVHGECYGSSQHID